MPTRIGLISDVHATPSPLQKALSLFREEGVDKIFCAGDIAGYGNALEATVQLLIDHDCRSILGNHETWLLDMAEAGETSLALTYFNTLPATMDMMIEGKRVYMVHAHPPQSDAGGIRLLDESGKLLPEQRETWSDRLAEFAYDVLIVGHSHQVFAEQLGNTLLINPGSTKFNNSCATLRLPDQTVQWFALSQKPLVKAWNWGRQFQQAE